MAVMSAWQKIAKFSELALHCGRFTPTVVNGFSIGKSLAVAEDLADLAIGSKKDVASS